MLHEMHSIVIQRHTLGFICRRYFAQLRRSVICIQKISREYLTRRAIRLQLMNQTCSEPSLSELESSDSSSVTIDVDGNNTEEQVSSNSSQANASSMEGNEVLNHQLMLGLSAVVIQSWFRRKPRYIYPPHNRVRTDTAALLITKTLRAHVAIKKARLELETLRHRYAAATSIQCRVRVVQAAAKVSSNCAIIF